MILKKKPGIPSPQRSDYRYSIFTDLSMSYEGSGEEVHLHTPDLSPRGMFIHTSQPFPEGSVVRVKFRLIRTNFKVDVRSEVRYCLAGVGIGVEFVDISPEAQRAIETELGVGVSTIPVEP